MITQRQLHQILLQPTDVLFFRDGRPMSGSLVGHTAAWPLPDVTNHALHAALHRADLERQTGKKLHTHRRGRSGNYSEEETHRDRKFGSLLTAGPFPVDAGGGWFFPRPKDAQLSGSVAVTLRPVCSLAKEEEGDTWGNSSLPDPLEYAVANTQSPDKDAGGEPWISLAEFNAYLRDDTLSPPVDDRVPRFLRDADLADIEHTIGIGIDPQTETQDKANFYSAHYLRLREGFRLGLFAEAMDKIGGDLNQQRDLFKVLFNDHPQSIIVGGQQRICSAHCSNATKPLALPRGLSAAIEFHRLPHGSFAVKWVLLTPGIWPEIPGGMSTRGTERRHHRGGWLPNWVCPETSDVLLETVSEEERRCRRSLNAAGKGYESKPGRMARLVAAVVPKPIPVTGWALANDSDRADGGAKSTHLAVPAGSVYYFEAASAEAAAQLAATLNWHGSRPGTEIKNRRSTLMGEKGFGLGVCGTWKFYGT
ncbi:MAG: type III-B CRISPR module-associated Cmr3 family protein [Verrucomicrobiota bacterium]